MLTAGKIFETKKVVFLLYRPRLAFLRDFIQFLSK